MTIGFTCNDGYFDGAYLTALSILRRTKEVCHFVLLSGDYTEWRPNFTMFSKEHTKIMEKLVKSFNRKNTFEVIDTRPLWNKHFKNLRWRRIWARWWPSPYTITRLFIYELPQFQNKILFLDVDLMFTGDIKELYDIDLGDKEIAMSRDLFTRYKKFKRYYNSGVMLIDMKKLRQSHNFEKCIKYILEKRPMIVEQDAISFICNAKLFPGNDFRYNYQADYIQPDTLVKHFWGFLRLRPSHRGIKQWQIEKVQQLLGLHTWDEDYKYYLEQKAKWKKN